MGSQEVIEVLEKYKNPMCQSEINKYLGWQQWKLNATIKRLIKSKEIDFIEVDRFKARDHNARIKKRIKLYFTK